MSFFMTINMGQSLMQFFEVHSQKMTKFQEIMAHFLLSTFLENFTILDL